MTGSSGASKGRAHVTKAASSSEREARADFAHRYSLDIPAALRDVEREVIGEVWGANGFTTLAQADDLGAALGLVGGRSLLDIGTGRGWPGLYLAKKTGCEVVLADLPIEGLKLARARAEAEGIAFRGVLVSARFLPFAERSFDAITHTDVLC